MAQHGMAQPGMAQPASLNLSNLSRNFTYVTSVTCKSLQIDLHFDSSCLYQIRTSKKSCLDVIEDRDLLLCTASGCDAWECDAQNFLINIGTSSPGRVPGDQRVP